MKKIRIEINIEKCWDCPKCISKRLGEAYDYYCGVNNKKIAGCIEYDWEMPEVPDWCPLLIK